MQTLLFTFFIGNLFYSLLAYADCQNEAIIVTRENGFGISFGFGGWKANSGQSLRTNIPIKGPNGWGCFEQNSRLDYEVQSNSDSFQGEMLIQPVRGSFTDVENGSMQTYVKTSVAITESGSPQVQIALLSTICAGSQILAVESFEGTIRDFLIEREFSMRVQSTFSTGKAAQNLQRGFRKKQLPTLFAENLKQVEFLKIDEKTWLVPSIYLNTEIQTNAVNSNSEFSTLRSEQILCTQQAQRALSDFRIENLSGQNEFLQLEYSSWKKRGKISWDLKKGMK